MRQALKFTVFCMATLLSAFTAHATPKPSEKNAYDFTFSTLMGEEILPLSGYRGKVILVVNTASKCGFTPQYKGLQALYETYRERGLVIVGVPSNDFGEQEPGTAAEIKEFCEVNFGVTFPMTAKQVVSGKAAHPFYVWARDVLGGGAAPKWNFHKYLIAPDGKLVDYFSSNTTPDAEKLTSAIEKLLPQP